MPRTIAPIVDSNYTYIYMYVTILWSSEPIYGLVSFAFFYYVDPTPQFHAATTLIIVVAEFVCRVCVMSLG